ncbi:uncharacterized protein METZ01_LOCUS162962, partial [marine metagenome]
RATLNIANKLKKVATASSREFSSKSTNNTFCARAWNLLRAGVDFD